MFSKVIIPVSSSSYDTCILVSHEQALTLNATGAFPVCEAKLTKLAYLTKLTYLTLRMQVLIPTCEAIFSKVSLSLSLSLSTTHNRKRRERGMGDGGRESGGVEPRENVNGKRERAG